MKFFALQPGLLIKYRSRQLQTFNDFVLYFSILNGKTETKKKMKSADPRKSCMPEIIIVKNINGNVITS